MIAIWITGITILVCSLLFSKDLSGTDAFFLIIFVLFVTGAVADQVRKQSYIKKREDAKELLAEYRRKKR